MATTLVVDGYNAINAIPEVQKKLKTSLKSARSTILAISKEYARSSGYITDVRVVFDGSDKNRRKEARMPHGKNLVFSGTGKGDEKIIETVKKCAQKGKVVLASNDNYVRNNARAYNAKIISSEELTSTKKRVKSSSKSSEKKIDKSLQDEITREYKERLGL